ENISKEKFKFIVHDIDVGFPVGQDPIPLTPTCLNDEAIIGTTTTIHYGSQVEPSIAVNPVDPSKIVVAWQQDRINNGAALEIGIAFSSNFGKSWKQTVVPLNICIGGITQRASDVWLSYSKNGKKVYLNALLLNATFVPNAIAQSGIIVSISKDNGATWSTPIYLITSGFFLSTTNPFDPLEDKNSITADPNKSNLVYSVWDHF